MKAFLITCMLVLSSCATMEAIGKPLQLTTGGMCAAAGGAKSVLDSLDSTYNLVDKTLLKAWRLKRARKKAERIRRENEIKEAGAL